MTREKTMRALLFLVFGLVCWYFGGGLGSESEETYVRTVEQYDSMKRSADAIILLQKRRSKLPEGIDRLDRANIIGFIEGQTERRVSSRKVYLA